MRSGLKNYLSSSLYQMEFVIENHIREFGKTRARGQYSDATIKNYISSIRSLHRMVNGKEAMFDDLDW